MNGLPRKDVLAIHPDDRTSLFSTLPIFVSAWDSLLMGKRRVKNGADVDRCVHSGCSMRKGRNKKWPRDWSRKCAPKQCRYPMKTRFRESRHSLSLSHARAREWMLSPEIQRRVYLWRNFILPDYHRISNYSRLKNSTIA